MTTKKVRKLDRTITVALIALFILVVWLAPDVKAASPATALRPGCAGGVSWLQASHSIGKTVRLDGAVLGAKYVQWKSGKGSMTFLDFGGRYPNAKFTAIIWNRDASNLAGKRVCLTGKVTLYHGKPEMSVG